jgi:hypothetical protein
LRTETLLLTYDPSNAKVGPGNDENTIAERLKKLRRGEAMLDRAIDLLWSDNRWVSVPVEELILVANKPSPLVSPTARRGTETLSRHASGLAVAPDEQEVLELPAPRF